LIRVTSDLKEPEAYALLTLSVQAVILSAHKDEETTQTQIKSLRETLEKVHQEDKDKETPSVPSITRSKEG
jgi:hypothetical protein